MNTLYKYIQKNIFEKTSKKLNDFEGHEIMRFKKFINIYTR